MVRYFFTLLAVILLLGCGGDNPNYTPPTIVFQAGTFTQDGEEVPLGGKLSFGIVANGGGEPLTNIRVQRVMSTGVITESDLGLFIPDQDYHYTLNAVKSNASQEIWRFMAMNANRDSAVLTLTVNLGEGTAYGPIKHFESIKIGMHDNTEFPHFLNVTEGVTYTSQTVTGNEAGVDVLAFVYYTGGKWSPTLNCPQYTTTPSYYPVVSNWPTRNSTVYDYNATDNDLVQLDEFLAASNDSLLVSSFKPGTSSGNCKFCYTGKLVPFKTQQGKYGIIRVKHADITTDGYMELEIKVQE